MNNDHSLIQHNIPLADKNWFKTGGAARFFAEPKTQTELVESLNFARTNNLPLFVLGQGANILISDDGFAGLVIRPCLTTITLTEIPDSSEVLVTADAGVTLHELITWSLEHDILGLEEFSGIPGTVGGSVYINLHYFEFLLSQFIEKAQVLEYRTNTIHTVDNGWFQFGYNTSKLHTKQQLLVNATFRLKKGSSLDIAYAKGRHTEIIRHRAARYPTNNTCGSFFRNFHEHEVSLTSNGKKMIYVAYYLDKIGVKGELRCGGALVSYQHANMLINAEKATSQDIVTLARTMQEMVYKQFYILPQPECQLIGFSHYPLLTLDHNIKKTQQLS